MRTGSVLMRMAGQLDQTSNGFTAASDVRTSYASAGDAALSSASEMRRGQLRPSRTP